jgi:hypothetical protein
MISWQNLITAAATVGIITGRTEIFHADVSGREATVFKYLGEDFQRVTELYITA